MALTPSTMLALGTPAPTFNLPDVVSGKKVTLSEFASKKCLLVMFICQHCPYIQHIKSELSKLVRDYAGKDIAVVGISSNDAEHYPDDSPAALKTFAQTE